MTIISAWSLRRLMTFNSVRKFEIETSKLSLIWVSRLPILLEFNFQLMHSGLELFFFIKKHLFLTIYNNFRQIYCRVHLSIYPNSVFNGFFNQFWFLKRIIWSCITKDLWSCYLRMAFRDGDNFCKAFARALVNMSYQMLR